MKKVLSITMAILLASCALAEQPDSNAFAQQEQRLRSLESYCRELQRHDKTMKRELGRVNQQISATDSTVTGLKHMAHVHLAQVDCNIQGINKDILNIEDEQHRSTIWGIIIASTLAAAASAACLRLHSRINKKGDDIELLRNRADDLNRQLLTRMDKELSELHGIATTLLDAHSSTHESNLDHSLIKTLADRINFMETTLFHMDNSTKGHKQLTKSIKSMKDNLLASGYEIVDMLGKEYVPGLKATPSFIDDESLERGKRIISGVTKPQINYRGTMIQAAQITVSQNI